MPPGHRSELFGHCFLASPPPSTVPAAEAPTRLTLDLKTENGRITEATFQARACAPVVAVASLATEMIQGLEINEAGKLDIDIFQIEKELGGLPPL